MNHLLKVIIVAGFILINQAIAQQIPIAPPTNEATQPGRYPDYIDFTAMPLTFKKGEVAFIDDAGKVFWSKNVVLNRVEEDQIGYKHYRYQQTYGGFAVEHAIFIVRVNDENKIVAENGKMVKDFPEGLATRPVINKLNALNIAISEIGARQYKWEILAEEAFLKKEQDNPAATYYPKE